MPLEIAVFNLPSARNALLSGSVDRIELCGGPLSSGGVTPAIATFQALARLRSSLASGSESAGNAPVPIHVMIRPRGGDFVYSDAEFEEMLSSMRAFLDLDACGAEAGSGPEGFVFGILKRSGSRSGSGSGSGSGSEPEERMAEGWRFLVDEKRNKRLVDLAASRGKSCTFHRAFDVLVNPSHAQSTAQDSHEALEAVIRCSFSAVLTSGAVAGGVDAGRSVLGDLIRQAAGRIEVMPGGGVRSGNSGALWEEGVRATWWHSSAIVRMAVGDVDGREVDGEADIDEIVALKEVLLRLEAGVAVKSIMIDE